MRAIFVFCLLILSVGCAQPAKLTKINGVSFVAHRDSVNQKHIKPVVNLNANYAAIMPFGFIRDLNHPEIVFNTNRQWFGETRTGVKQYIFQLKKEGIKTMVKPQIWVGRGMFTGFIKLKTEAEWAVFEASYTDFILQFAEVAQETNAEIFCIGTELEGFVDSRPAFWFGLIKKVKAIYKGKLTYAANWNEFNRTPFWEALDFIGIDAYFPVSDSKTPTVEACLHGWKKHKADILTVQQANNKPVLFTEFGYRSVDYSGRKPWVSDRDMNQVNLQAQVNTTEALFKTFWDEPWFAGGFVWKWFVNHNDVGGENNHQFTPQNKPVEALIKNEYAKKRHYKL
ncbi:glycoside hydrolase [Tamlana nanhaiensis]|uniref:Glycoside hydrolase n=1 Tax=Neotamlana nanhaiensis TaxID=1382798 RepID=A0A0D7VXI9_9FLAO|nr:glycoside hydrolase [Tamlana nanhaiensis]KJD31566.1 glycoside hydrolase [Tamlana nanhaiensis]